MQANGGLLRIDADGEIISHHLKDIAADFLRVAAVVGQTLEIRDEDKLLVVVLEQHALAQGTDVVAEVQLAGRTVAGQDRLAGVHK